MQDDNTISNMSPMRAMLERYRATVLGESPKTRQTRALAEKIAADLSSPSSELAREAARLWLPGDRVGRIGANGDIERFEVTLEDSDAAFRSFYTELVVWVDCEEQSQEQMRANEALSPAQVRDLVLRTIYELDLTHDDGAIRSFEIAAAAFISERQLRDALDHLAKRQAIRIVAFAGGGTDYASCILRLTAHGRDLVRGDATDDTITRAPSISAQTVTIGTVGTNYGLIHQHVEVSNVPPMPSDVRSALIAHPMGKIVAKTLDQEIAKGPSAAHDIKEAIDGAKSFFDAVNTGAEAAEHAQTWFQAVLDWLAMAIH